jgi:ubiquitin-small subunit ribosomal protein S27Ae
MDLTKKKDKYKKSKFYDTSNGVIKRTAKFCPKCGPGVFLAEHKDRVNCGACGYTEMKGKVQNKEEINPKAKENTSKEETKE